MHTFHNYRYRVEQYCNTIEHTCEIFFVGSGTLISFLSTVILFSSYIFVILCVLRKKAIKFSSRIELGIIVCLLGVLSLFCVDLIGHSLKSNTANHTQCISQVYKNDNETLYYPSLNMHWSNVLLGIGPLIVITTTLEFISAQSTLSIYGLVIGVFFAISGLFQFLNSIIIVPLSLKHP